MTTPASAPIPAPAPRETRAVRSMVTIILPAQLCTLAHVDREVHVAVAAESASLTQRALLDALELAYPMLRGTIRDHVTRLRRPYLRFFACGEDLSHDSPDAPLPREVADGAEPFLVVGSVAGG